MCYLNNHLLSHSLYPLSHLCPTKEKTKHFHLPPLFLIRYSSQHSFTIIFTIRKKKYKKRREKT